MRGIRDLPCLGEGLVSLVVWRSAKCDGKGGVETGGVPEADKRKSGTMEEGFSNGCLKMC